MTDAMMIHTEVFTVKETFSVSYNTVQYALFRLEVHRGRLLNTEQYTVHTVLSTYVCHNRLGNGMTRERKILKGFTNMHEII